MESFCAACGTPGPLTIEVEQDGVAGTIRHAFDRPFLIIGRGPRSDLRIDHPDVSLKHAYLQLIGGHLFLIDLDSRSGVHVEGERLASGWIGPIRIGPSQIRVRSASVLPDRGPAVGSNSLSAYDSRTIADAEVTLSIKENGGAHLIPIVEPLTMIGRSARCKIRLILPKLSRFHAALVRTGGSVWVIDLHAREGVTVNGSRVNHMRLADGDELKIGPLVARIGITESNGRAITPRSQAMQPSLARSTAPEFPPGGFELGPLLEQVTSIQGQSGDQFSQVILMLTRLFGSMHREMVDLVREEMEQIRRLSDEMQAMRAESAAGKTITPLESQNRPPASKATLPSVSGDSRERDAPGSVEPTRPREPGEVHMIVSERLAIFEQERQSRWNKISKILLKSDP